MKRREVTQLLGSSMIALHLGLLTGCGRKELPAGAKTLVGDSGARAAVEEIAGGLSGIEFIGPVCDRHVAAQDPLGMLLDELRKYSGTVLEALQASFARDFERGDVIEIDGWRLSRSECLLVAGGARLQGMSEPQLTRQGGFRTEQFIVVEQWGPKRTVKGKIFNPIGNGRGGFWLRVSGEVNGSMRLELNGVELATHFEPGLITASLEPSYMEQIISTPGVYELVLLDKSRRLRQSVGFLSVVEPPPMATLADGSRSEVFCVVERWGPDWTVAGEAFNRQPDGSAGFWVRIGCAPQESVLMLDGVELPTIVHSDLVTARVPHYEDLGRGRHPLVLVDRASGESLFIGEFEVR